MVMEVVAQCCTVPCGIYCMLCYQVCYAVSASWFDVSEKEHTNVYVSGLPSEITLQDFQELMNKCGLIVYDPITHKPKLKLYKDCNGVNKGDGLCCYIKVGTGKNSGSWLHNSFYAKFLECPNWWMLKFAVRHLRILISCSWMLMFETTGWRYLMGITTMT